jgi:hypothetical protein
MVAFLDILGFEELVERSRNDANLVSKLAHMLKRSKEVAATTTGAKLSVLKIDPSAYTYRAFSDTVLISGPHVSHDDISFISIWVMYYQYLMWKEENTFIRGAIVYGDIYEDQDVVFGPAVIDAYHLERSTTNAKWQRVLVDQSLLNRETKAELKRDSLEFMRRGDDALIYLDYLRDLFHLFVVAENEKVTGHRSTDFDKPIKLFEDHKAAILMQVNNVLKQANQDKVDNILEKYVELSKYHNATIDILCRVIDELTKNEHIIDDFVHDLLTFSIAKNSGAKYAPKYSAEEHPEQSDMLNILGSAINIIVRPHEKDDATLEQDIDAFRIELPKELLKLREALVRSKIELDGLKFNL